MTITKKSTNNKCQRRCGENEPSYAVVGNVIAAATMKNDMEVPWNIKNRVTIWPSNSIPGHISGENHNSSGYMHPDVHCSTICTCQDMEAT